MSETRRSVLVGDRYRPLPAPDPVRQIAVLRDALNWYAQTVHRAHHDGAFDACPKNTCAHARDILARTG